jgi:NAD(P)-dependent dehydrogenase (short-subunit alcohol dehydrogenase family)
MAKALAECGAKVAILDLKKENADKVADEIKKAGGNAIGVSANVLEPASLQEAEKEVSEKLGSVTS